jgi:hypothetical protein
MKKYLATGVLTLAALVPMSVFGQNAFVQGGQTTVALSTDFVSALSSLGVQAAAVKPGMLANGVATFPVTGGLAVKGGNIEINHIGGLSLSAGSTTVELVSFTIDAVNPAAPVLSGVVLVNGAVAGRLPLFDLTLNTMPRRAGTLLAIRNVGLTLTSTAASALNSVFNVTAFEEGLSIGTANSNALLTAPFNLQ